MKQIVAGLHYVTGLMVGRVYVIEDPDGLTVIDAGISSAPRKIVRQIEALGRRAKDVKRILITHAHPDHVGGLHELQQLTGAQVIASKVEQPVVEGRQAITRRPKGLRPPNTMVKGTPVDRAVEDGDRIDVFGGLQVVFTPGHSPGHIAFWQPDRRILFCGDVIFRAPTPSLRLPFAMLTVDMHENIRSVKRLAELDAAIVCFGHGDPLTENTAQHVRDFARKVSLAGS
jgi:glyoxylase-like metal-dependent hydrolase (beta-lactamase superfamily II)